MTETIKTSSTHIEFVSPLSMQTCIQRLQAMGQRKGLVRASTRVRLSQVDHLRCKFYINKQSFVEAEGVLTTQTETSTRVSYAVRYSLQSKVGVVLMIIISPLVIFNLVTQTDPFVILIEILWFVLLFGQFILLPRMRLSLQEKIQAELL
jgi:hypothetical protein